MGNQVCSTHTIESLDDDVINDDYCLIRFKRIIGLKVNQEKYNEMFNTFTEYLKTYNDSADYPNSVVMLDQLIKSVYFTHIMYQIPSELAIFVFEALGSNFDDYLDIIYAKTFEEIEALVTSIKNKLTDSEIIKKRLHFLTKFIELPVSVHPCYHVWKCMNGRNRLGNGVYFNKRSNTSEKDQQDIAEIERINKIIISWFDGTNYTHNYCENLMININNNHINGRSYQYIVVYQLLNKLPYEGKYPE